MKTSISSTVYGKEFLSKTWKDRNNLSEYERRGFGQFFYLTLCSHIELVLVKRINARVNSIESLCKCVSIPLFETSENGVSQQHSSEPAVKSVEHMASKISKEAEKAALMQLIKLYDELFPVSISNIIGEDLYQDLKAVGNLRNIFAHGRDIFMEFNRSGNLKNMIFEGTLDNNPFKQPEQCLRRAGIITKSFKITSKNHDDFFSLFFKDKTMLHFYNAIKEIETHLKTENHFPPEHFGHLFHVPELPDLKETTKSESA